MQICVKTQIQLSSSFVIIIVLFRNTISARKKTTSIFKVLISTIKFPLTECFKVQHKHAIKSKNNSYLHLLPHV